MNGTIYLDFLIRKITNYMVAHDRDIFMHENDPCHRSDLLKYYLQEEI